jgi:hypothetical protein
MNYKEAIEAELESEKEEDNIPCSADVSKLTTEVINELAKDHRFDCTCNYCGELYFRET